MPIRDQYRYQEGSKPYEFTHGQKVRDLLIFERPEQPRPIIIEHRRKSISIPNLKMPSLKRELNALHWRPKPKSGRI